MKTYAIYARVSDESQLKGDSIDHQISYCMEHARRKSLEEKSVWEISESFIYIDEGITGTSLVKRDAVKRLIRDARLGCFQIVLFKGISRFARDTVDALLMLRALTASGVRVISMEENFDSQYDHAEFIFTIHSALAQAESEKTAIRVRVGVSQKAKTGQWNGQPPDGYFLNSLSKHLEIDEEFATRIRGIFMMYLSGLGCRKIAQELNKKKQYTKRGNLWSAKTISRVLNNPAYVGDVVYGRREKRFSLPDNAQEFTRKKSVIWVNDQTRIVRCANAHPAIVPRWIFDAVQESLEIQRFASGSDNHQFLLTKGRLLCQCGSRMTITYNRSGIAYYRCTKKKECKKSIGYSKYLRALDLEQLVLMQLRSDILAALEFNGFEIPHFVESKKEIEIKDRKKSPHYDLSVLQEFVHKEHGLINGETSERFIRAAIHQYLQSHSANTALSRRLISLFVEKIQVFHLDKNSSELKIKYHFNAPNHVLQQ